ncbi:MAG: lipoate--protein ligase [Chitinophagaceae bacterium]|nr:lipoate--protein ligase [Chitinophagaceae bacterium]MCW5904266.1 lipoate--protein ligase [Chitinophagaceae bacterium]
MLCIYHESTDPYFNIAADEYILKYLKEDCFMLWRNDNAIIVGKYQNTLSEINYDYVKANNIAVVRRISGGGAVYHDLGNLNFSFVKAGEDSNLTDFKKFTQPIVDVIQSLGVDARFEGKNDLMIDGKKFSGNAAHIYRNRILHHGTILFASEMRNVSEALKINPVKYQDKAVKSVPKRVTNISEHLKTPLSLEAFTKKLMEHVLTIYPDSKLYSFTEDDIKIITQLRDEKYTTHEWNYGKSPDYSFKKAIRTKGGLLEMNIETKNGIIENVKIFGDFFSEKGIEAIENALLNVAHEENAIRTALSKFDIDKHFSNITIDELIEAMF